MTMGRIDHQAIHTRVNQFLSAFTKITGRANSGGDPKPAQVVFHGDIAGCVPADHPKVILLVGQQPAHDDFMGRD